MGGHHMNWQGIIKTYDDALSFSEQFFQGGHYLIDAPAQIEIEKRISGNISAGATAVTNCGMAAIGCVFDQLLNYGDTALFSTACYPGTFRLIKELKEKKNILVRWVDPGDLNSLISEIDNGSGPAPKLYFAEVIGNSLRMPVLNWDKTLGILGCYSTKMVVDTTFYPAFKPFLRQNKDVEVIEVASLTKWETLHDRVAGGRISGSESFIRSIKDSSYYRQVVMQPIVAERIDFVRGLLKFHTISAKTTDAAIELERSKAVQSVYYPGLNSHPDHELIRTQCYGAAGGIIYAVFKDEKSAAYLTDLLGLSESWSIAASFAGEDWRIFPFIGELAKYSPAENGVVVRISVGEKTEGLEDLKDALKNVEALINH